MFRFIVAAAVVGAAFANSCVDLFAMGSSSGSVVNQLCLWAPGGFIEIPMFLKPVGVGRFDYVETWDNANSAVAPFPIGVQRGQAVMDLSPFDASTNCNISLVNNVLATPVARNWTSAGPSEVAFGNRDSQGNTVFLLPTPAQSAACTIVRLWGSVCEAMLERLQTRLAIGLPPVKLAMNPQTVCY